MNYDFLECPDCGYGVRDSGENCVTCGGVGGGGFLQGGLFSPPGSMIGSGDIIVERETGRRISPAEYAEITKRARPDAGA